MATNTNAGRNNAIYELRWRTPSEAKSAPTIDALIETLAYAAEKLRALAAAGVTVEQVAGDRLILITRNATVAKQYGFRRREDDQGVRVGDCEGTSRSAADAHGDRQWRVRVTCARP